MIFGKSEAVILDRVKARWSDTVTDESAGIAKVGLYIVHNRLYRPIQRRLGAVSSFMKCGEFLGEAVYVRFATLPEVNKELSIRFSGKRFITTANSWRTVARIVGCKNVVF